MQNIGIESVTSEELRQVAEKSCIPEESIHSMPFPVSPDAVAAAIVVADQLGRAYRAKG